MTTQPSAVVKILAFTDPHGSIESARSIVSLALRSKPDLIVCSGDFSFCGEQYLPFLEELGTVAKDVWYVPGNHESDEVARRVSQQHSFMKDISYRTVEAGAVRLAGVPGTVEFWPGEDEEPEAFELACRLWEGVDRRKPLVFLTHFPPAGTAISGTTHPTPDAGGSRVVRRIIEMLKPEVVICGHYHQDFGKTCRLSVTRLHNPGPDGTIIRI